MKIAIYILLMISPVFSQLYNSADPYYLFKNELQQFNNIIPFHQTSVRPFYKNSGNFFNISFKNEIYFNNNAPNQENMDVRYFAKGIGSFTSIRLTGYSKFIAFNFEPYKITSSNIEYKNYERSNPFKFLNDSKTNEDLNDLGLRKADIYLHYNGIGFGLTKDNMWWGPGIQGSISMTNNTFGFNNFMIGTLREIRYKKIGIMARYTFSELNLKGNYEKTYFTSLTGQVTYYSRQIITIGLSRNYLTGGVDVGVPWTKKDAQNIVFEGLFIKNLQQLDYTIAGHDPWDQTVSGWIDITFPRNKMKLYLEIGFNDNRFNLWDFIVHPDHAMGSIIGFRKYGLFNNKNLIAGFEYVNLIKGRHHIFRITPNWYDRRHYDDFSYDGRRWGAHSGSDSDDLLLFFGLMNKKWTLIPSFNFERHGVSTHRPPEIKSEFKIDARYRYKLYEIGLLYENQFEAHLGFPPDQYFIDEITGVRRTNTLIIKLTADLH
ncbi:capsule assembly Wzi family protein [Candidatus Marinimicrobia bacterium]|nr:capsule assembly Wzi family protein [Candidatus Neomarinimicrobiota bacterium]